MRWDAWASDLACRWCEVYDFKLPFNMAWKLFLCNSTLTTNKTNYLRGLSASDQKWLQDVFLLVFSGFEKTNRVHFIPRVPSFLLGKKAFSKLKRLIFSLKSLLGGLVVMTVISSFCWETYMMIWCLMESSQLETFLKNSVAGCFLLQRRTENYGLGSLYWWTRTWRKQHISLLFLLFVPFIFFFWATKRIRPFQMLTRFSSVRLSRKQLDNDYETSISWWRPMEVNTPRYCKYIRFFFTFD